MSKLWFVGDTHFGSHKLARGDFDNDSKRPKFKDAYEHDDWLIDLWNSTVNKRDVVWVLGDFAISPDRMKSVGPRLNGIKHLILGNHDRGSPELWRESGFHNTIHAFRKFKEGAVLTHIPVHPTQLEYRWGYNIHGHIHDVRKYPSICPETGYFNVNVCATGGLTRWDVIREKMRGFSK